MGTLSPNEFYPGIPIMKLLNIFCHVHLVEAVGGISLVNSSFQSSESWTWLHAAGIRNHSPRLGSRQKMARSFIHGHILSNYINTFNRWLMPPTGCILKVKVKVAHSCPTICNPMVYTVLGILQARILEWIAFPFLQRIFPTQEPNQGLLHCRWILYQLSHQGYILVVV